MPRSPSPEEADLRQAAGAFGLISADSVGLALGYGIFMRPDCLNDPKLIAHELKHVAQYERHGIPAFFRQYLAEVNHTAIRTRRWSGRRSPSRRVNFRAVASNEPIQGREARHAVIDVLTSFGTGCRDRNWIRTPL